MASAPASITAFTSRTTSAGSTRPCKVQPNAVLMPTSMRVREPRASAHRDPRNLLDHLVGRLVQVGQAVRMTGRERQQHQVGLALDGTFGALEIGHQHRRLESGQGLGESHEFGRIRQLRQQASRHEGADLDLALAGLVGIADPLKLGRSRYHARDDLQAVAQTHLAYHDSLGSIEDWLMAGLLEVRFHEFRISVWSLLRNLRSF